MTWNSLCPLRAGSMRTWNKQCRITILKGPVRKGAYIHTFTPPDFLHFLWILTQHGNRCTGKTHDEKLGSLGVTRDRMLDIRMLDEISRTYGIEVFLFFEEDLARSRTAGIRS